MYQHRRKPIRGEAVQFTEDGKSDSVLASWFGIHPQRVRETDALSAHTLSGVARRVNRGKGKFMGDWLIRTKSGGLYVCPEADFAEHYMKMEDIVPPPPPPRASPPPEIPAKGLFGRLRKKLTDDE